MRYMRSTTRELRWRRSRAQMGRLKYCLPETSPFFSGAPYMDSVYERTENAQNKPPWTIFAIYTVVEAVGEFDSCSIRPNRNVTRFHARQGKRRPMFWSFITLVKLRWYMSLSTEIDGWFRCREVFECRKEWVLRHDQVKASVCLTMTKTDADIGLGKLIESNR